MPLPFPSMNFTPLDPLTAQELNDMVSNIEALQDFSAFDAGSFDIALLPDDGVTEAKQVIKSSYSTSEVNTGAKWIDGKAIYKKTISTGQLPNTTTKNVAHGISGFSHLVSLSGSAWGASDQIPLPYVHNTGPVAVFVNSTNVGIVTYSNRSDQTSSYVTIYYTKT